MEGDRAFAQGKGTANQSFHLLKPLGKKETEMSSSDGFPFKPTREDKAYVFLSTWKQGCSLGSFCLQHFHPSSLSLLHGVVHHPHRRHLACFAPGNSSENDGFRRGGVLYIYSWRVSKQLGNGVWLKFQRETFHFRVWVTMRQTGFSPFHLPGFHFGYLFFRPTAGLAYEVFTCFFSPGFGGFLWFWRSSPGFGGLSVALPVLQLRPCTGAPSEGQDLDVVGSSEDGALQQCLVTVEVHHLPCWKQTI